MTFLQAVVLLLTCRFLKIGNDSIAMLSRKNDSECSVLDLISCPSNRPYIDRVMLIPPAFSAAFHSPTTASTAALWFLHSGRKYGNRRIPDERVRLVWHFGRGELAGGPHVIGIIFYRQPYFAVICLNLQLL